MVEIAPLLLDRGMQLNHAVEAFRSADEALRGGKFCVETTIKDQHGDYFALWLSPHVVFSLYMTQRNLAKEIQGGKV